jgi:AraC-like DNA-binding protein
MGGAGAQAWTARAVTAIRGEFAGLRSVRQLARRLRCHPVYLARTFRQSLDIPVSDYLAAFKVGVAFRLLTHTQLKICAIPGVVGFGGKATLYRNVHRLTGRAPGYWREVRRSAAAADDGARATHSMTIRSVRDERLEGGPGFSEPDPTGPWMVPRAVATLMRPLSMRDPPC